MLNRRMKNVMLFAKATRWGVFWRVAALLMLGGWAVFLGPACGSQESCLNNGDCPVDASCLLVTRAGKPPIRLCVREVATGAIGSSCQESKDCRSNFCYRAIGASDKYCSQPCDAKQPCPGGFKCDSITADLDVCVREGGTVTPTEGCKCGADNAPCTKNGHTDCDVDKGYFCLSAGPKDPKAVCTRQCKVGAAPGDDGACAPGFVCSEGATGLNVCVKPQFTPGDKGASCAVGGKAQCGEGTFCYAKYASDPDAFCSAYCNPYEENSCGKGFVCESPRERDPWLCVPEGTKDIGGDCAQRSFLDCKKAICAQEDISSDKYFCTESCRPDVDTCPAGWRCKLFGHIYRYLCSEAGSGTIGSLCTKNGAAECQSKICISPGPGAINKICTQACDANAPCPGGFVCDTDKGHCIPKTGNKQIGEECSSPQDCIYGTCASDTSGKQFCTQQCTNNDQCPEGFVCRNLEFTLKFCLPKQAGDRKLGEPCPNGPGDCVTGNCLADPLNNRTFCTQPCDDQMRACPQPYKCTRLNDREAYCTPQDYQLP